MLGPAQIIRDVCTQEFEAIDSLHHCPTNELNWTEERYMIPRFSVIRFLVLLILGARHHSTSLSIFLLCSNSLYPLFVSEFKHDVGDASENTVMGIESRAGIWALSPEVPLCWWLVTIGVPADLYWLKSATVEVENQLPSKFVGLLHVQATTDRTYAEKCSVTN